MDSNNISFDTLSYNATKAFCVIFPIYILLIGLSIATGVIVHKPIIGVIGWISISALPFLIQKKVKRLFTRKVTIEFSEKGFFVNEYSLDNDKLIDASTFYWSDIKSYQFSISRTNTTYLKLISKNDVTKSIIFNEGISIDKALSQQSIIRIFISFVAKENYLSATNKGIVYKLGFLATRAGTITLIAIGVLSAIAIAIHLIFKPNSFPFSFLSLFLILGLSIKRKQDISLAHRIQNIYSEIDK